MSRVDDRIRARLQMQIVLSAIAVVAMVVGVALVLAWLLWPTIEGLLRPSHEIRAPSTGWMMRDRVVLLSFGLGAFVPGLVLLKMADWLASRWLPTRHHGMCPECDYPRDDPTIKSCPDCGHEFFRERESAVKKQVVTGETI